MAVKLTAEEMERAKEAVRRECGEIMDDVELAEMEAALIGVLERVKASRMPNPEYVGRNDIDVVTAGKFRGVPGCRIGGVRFPENPF